MSSSNTERSAGTSCGTAPGGAGAALLPPLAPEGSVPPLRASSTRGPFLGAPLLSSPHLTVLSAEKGNFSITAVKLISYLHWTDSLSYPLLLKLEPVALHRSASRIGLVSRIDCVTCFTLYRPVLQQIDTAFYAWSRPPSHLASLITAPIAFSGFVVVYI